MTLMLRKPSIEFKTQKGYERAALVREARTSLTLARNKLDKVEEKPHFENATFMEMRKVVLDDAEEYIRHAVKRIRKLRKLDKGV